MQQGASRTKAEYDRFEFVSTEEIPESDHRGPG